MKATLRLACCSLLLSSSHSWAQQSDRLVLLGLGDSTVHGTMDGVNNTPNTTNAFMQRLAEALGERFRLKFSQPLLNDLENRRFPFQTPSNLGVDGADLFSIEGIEYYQRVGAPQSFVTNKYLNDQLFPHPFTDKYDKVLYPINLRARRTVSQLDALIWHLNRRPVLRGRERALAIFWIGNNDSGGAALGAGGENPTFFTLPFEASRARLSPVLRLLLEVAQNQGAISFEPFTQQGIERNLTDSEDFLRQYDHVLARIAAESGMASSDVDLVLMTLPYYSSVGHLFDSEDLEFYLQQVDPDYRLPASFARVTPPGVPIDDPTRGDRVTLFTFGFMYLLLSTGSSVDEVNLALEVDGMQRDGLVLSEAEQAFIRARIDEFNEAVALVAQNYGPRVHLIDIGRFLNDGLTGRSEIRVGDRVLSRKWIRGSAFSFDGVHAGYAAQAVIANQLLDGLEPILGADLPRADTEAILAADPYIDLDGDGWAPGPDYRATGLTELLFFFKDASDADPAVGPDIPANAWERVSKVFISELLGIPAVLTQARQMGLRVEELR